MTNVDELDRKDRAIVEVLEELQEEGRKYVKSKDVARRSELTTRQVGQRMTRIEERGGVGRWAVSDGATTWSIEDIRNV